MKVKNFTSLPASLLFFFFLSQTVQSLLRHKIQSFCKYCMQLKQQKKPAGACPPELSHFGICPPCPSFPSFGDELKQGHCKKPLSNSVCILTQAMLLPCLYLSRGIAFSENLDLLCLCSVVIKHYEWKTLKGSS